MKRVSVVRGDITAMPVDAIVTAANSALAGGGGVDGAIHRAAGPELLAECREIGGCPTGSAVMTGAYELPARHVIHAVGPVWHGGAEGEDDLLRSCYLGAIRLAEEAGLRSISFPAISCGVYGFPIARAARVAVSAIAEGLESAESLEQILLVAFSTDIEQALKTALSERLGKSEERAGA